MIKLILTGLCILCLLNITAYLDPINKPRRRHKGSQGLKDVNDEGVCSHSRLNHGW